MKIFHRLQEGGEYEGIFNLLWHNKKGAFIIRIPIPFIKGISDFCYSSMQNMPFIGSLNIFFEFGIAFSNVFFNIRSNIRYCFVCDNEQKIIDSHNKFKNKTNMTRISEKINSN